MPDETGKADASRFANLTYDDFRTLAQDGCLSRYERIGFPDSYRQGAEERIFEDLRAKLPALDDSGRRILDIGPGCSDLPLMILRLCDDREHHITLVDSPEMLAHLPDGPHTAKVEGPFPGCFDAVRKLGHGPYDAIVAYSVIHYVMPGHDIFAFLDRALALLAPAGRLLIGDVPNVSKRKRFFASETGVRYHRAFMRTDEPPAVAFNRTEFDLIDDAVIAALLLRARHAGFDAYVVPQPSELPMANRREDLLFIRP